MSEISLQPDSGAPKPEQKLQAKEEPLKVQLVHARVLEKCVRVGELICRFSRIPNLFRRRALILAALKRYPPQLHIEMAFQRLRHWEGRRLIVQARKSLRIRRIIAAATLLGWRAHALTMAVRAFRKSLIRKLPDR